MNKTEELKRLAGEVFEGAPSWANYASMDRIGVWWVYDGKPEPDEESGTWFIPDQTKGANDTADYQPTTDMDWKVTLVFRDDCPEQT